MPFWSSEKLKSKVNALNLISDFKEEALKHASYELAVGNEAFITSYETGTKKVFKKGEQISIPPGQFGLLITEEKVTVPTNAIAFISIRASIKFRGLVNISGFHVDPGFSGKLKFSIYNAGSQTIILDPGQRIFMIWYADLDQATDGYGPARVGQNELTGKNVEDLHGDVASPGALKKLFDELRADYNKSYGEFERNRNDEFRTFKQDCTDKNNLLENKITTLETNISTWKQLCAALLAATIMLFATTFLKFALEPRNTGSPNQSGSTISQTVVATPTPFIKPTPMKGP